MKRTMTLIACAALCGCATHTTVQIDKRYDQDTGKLVGEIATTTKARTFWESTSRLTDFKVSQTEKTQGVSVGSLNQESSSTNMTAKLEALARIAEAMAR